MFRRFLAIAAIVVGLTGAASHAQQPSRDQTETLSRRAADRLESLRREADRLTADARTVLGELRRLELEREIRATELQQARQAVQQATTELAAIDTQVSALSAASDAALPDLQARLVTLYKLGRGQYARLLLSAADLRQFGQAVRLVSALAEQDRIRVQQHQARLAELQAARDVARDRQALVRRLQSEAEHTQTASATALAAHEAMVRDIDTRRDLNAQYSSELLAAQERLQASLTGLGDGAPAAALPLTPFKGDLDWPVAGTVHQRFGMSMAGRPALRGIELAGAHGAAVQAVHDGTVAFADAFTGYGQLVIVDHGSQTFTLYGNLGELQVEKGERVVRGQPVGTVGLSGDTAALYFELRVDGRAVDPLQWLAKR
ncbi:MAG: peptidoglycan DD-metalloendopeptidase family protein [Vicinamibacterales bacterium]